MLDRQDLRDAWQYILLIAPAPLGALIGLRYAVQQTPRQQAFNFFLSCGLGFFVGWWAGELLVLSAAGVAVTTIVSCAVGMELMAGLLTAARGFAADPFGFLGKALDIAGRVFRRGAP
jgi:hypothetical protein